MPLIPPLAPSSGTSTTTCPTTAAHLQLPPC